MTDIDNLLDFDINEAANAETPGLAPLPLIPDNTVAAATVTKIEWKDTHEGKGKRLNVTYEILEGPFSTFPGGKGGRKVFDSYCLANPDNQSSVTFGRKDLARLVQALKFTSVPNPIEQIVNRPLVIVVGIEKAWKDRTGKERPASNKVKEWRPYSSTGATPPRTPAQGQARTAPPAGPAPEVIERSERSDGGQVMDDIPF